ncbi:MAG: hypothetical protein WA208_18405 [Thermoanaerobaculia bacterium]
MARTRKQIDIPASEAKFVLEAMYRDGKIAKQTLDEYRKKLGTEIRSLEMQLARLRNLAGPMLVGAAVAAVPAAARALRRRVPAVVKKVKRATTKKESPERIESRKLQGRYLGLMRQIPKNIVKQRFGKDAIKTKGKGVVIDEMAAYLSDKGSPAKKGRK